MSEENGGRSFGDALTEIAEGGLLRLVVSKPVQQAIGRLVYGVADIPIAKLEQWAQTIRVDTSARKQVSGALATRAKALAVKDPELQERALERWTQQLGRHQRARECIAARTLGHLAKDGVPHDAKTPSEQFMCFFEEIAERASSDELADLLARILAGEIRKPRTISLSTLQVAAVLDYEIVEALNAIRPYLFASNWLHIPPSKHNDWFTPLQLLSGVSLISDLQSSSLIPNGKIAALFVFGQHVIQVSDRDDKFPWLVETATLTRSGIELVSVLPASGEVDVEEIASGLAEHEGFEGCIKIAAIPANGEIDPATLRPFPGSSAGLPSV